MKNTRGICLILIFAIMAALAAGCGAIKVNPEKDRRQVVAEVNGEKILKGEVLDRLEAEKAQFYLTDEILKDPKQKEYVLEVKKQILDNIVMEKLLNQKAEKAGFVFNDEMKEEAGKDFESLKKRLEEDLKAADQAAGEETDKKDYSKGAQDLIDEQLQAMGMTKEEYIELIAQQKPIQKFSEKTVEDVKATQEDIQKYFDEELKKQKEDWNYSESAIVSLYEPNRIRIKHVMIELPEDEQQEYGSLVQEGKKDEAQQFLDKKLGGIKPQAEGIVARLKAGEDIDSIIKEVNPDQAEAMKQGLIMHKDTMYLPQEYKDAALKLSLGGISSPVGTSFGYFIIKMEEKLPEKTYTLEEKQEDLRMVVENEKKNEKWNSLMAEWKEKETKKYENKL